MYTTPYETKLSPHPRTSPTHALYWIMTQPKQSMAGSGLTLHQAAVLRESLVDTKTKVSALDVATKQRIDARINEVDRYISTKRPQTAKRKRGVSLALLKRKMQAFLFDAGVL